MRLARVGYWISTIFFCVGMSVAGCVYIVHPPFLTAMFHHLGYPSYFPYILGPAKLFGAAVLIAPGLLRLKEWAYGGFAITCGSAFVSHLAVGDGFLRADGTGAGPTILLSTILALSYITRPECRRLRFGQ